MLVVVLVLGALILGLNLLATVVVVRRDGLAAGGRLLQLLLVWLLPVVGAILCLAMTTTEGNGTHGGNGPGGAYDFSSGTSGESHGSHNHASHSHGDCSSDGGGDGGSCGD